MKKKGNGKDPARTKVFSSNMAQDVAYRIALDKFFQESYGSNVEKLQNFSKYVPRQNLSLFLARYEMFKRVLNIHGSIIECGVYLGGGLMTFAQLSTILEPYNYQRRIIGFDTFSGFPRVTQEDKIGTSLNIKKGHLAAHPKEYGDLERSIELYDANRPLNHMPKVELVKGNVEKTLPDYLKSHPHLVVSLLYLDLDLFAPTKAAIEAVFRRMPKGAVIAFDELNSDVWPGETLAVLKTIGIRNFRLERFAFEPMRSFAVLD